jgi:CRP-like cAMP-binding protein
MRKVREGTVEPSAGLYVASSKKSGQIPHGGVRETGPNFLSVGTLRVCWGFKGMPGLPLNRLLLALPPDDLARLMADLEQVSCQRGDILIDVDGPIHHVFFPDSGIVSVVSVYANGDIVEMATIGREGCTGFRAIFGATLSSVRFFVQVPGLTTRMSRVTFMRAMDSMPAFRTLMFAYVPAFLEQVLASVACNATHSLKQRLARWLLAMRDRVEGDQLFITQDLLADMLGAYRPSITHVARELERAGLIERGRRHIKILDREGLRKESCECYDLVRDRISSYLPKTYPSPL